MTKKLVKDVIKTISFVPGLVGIANVDFSKKPTALTEENWEKGISFTETSKGVEVKVAAIIGIDMRAKVVAKEISSSIKAVFKKANTKIDHVSIYIRGVK